RGASRFLFSDTRSRVFDSEGRYPARGCEEVTPKLQLCPSCRARLPAKHDVRFGSKADMCSAKRHVRFAPESDIKCDTGECPLWAPSRHWLKPTVVNFGDG